MFIFIFIFFSFYNGLTALRAAKKEISISDIDLDDNSNGKRLGGGGGWSELCWRGRPVIAEADSGRGVRVNGKMGCHQLWILLVCMLCVCVCVRVCVCVCALSGIPRN